jgi:hypothetical protein
MLTVSVPESRPARRSRRVIVGRVIGVVSLLIAGVIVYWAISSSTSEIGALTRGPIPVSQLDLHPGDQSVFLEGHLRHGVRVCHCPAALRARVTVDGPEGPVPVDHTNGEIYTVSNLDGVQIGAVNIAKPGRYTVRTHTTVGNRVAVGGYHGPGRLITPLLVATALFALSGIGFSVAYNARRAERTARPTGRAGPDGDPASARTRLKMRVCPELRFGLKAKAPRARGKPQRSVIAFRSKRQSRHAAAPRPSR